jgi:hypothetical protein
MSILSFFFLELTSGSLTEAFFLFQVALVGHELNDLSPETLVGWTLTFEQFERIASGAGTFQVGV